MKNKEKEDDAFLKSIRGAHPIDKKNTIQKKIPTNKKVKGVDKEVFIRKKNNDEITNNKKKEIKINYNIEEKNKINKKLKKGKIPIDKKIDLHGCSLIEAEEIFLSTVRNCYLRNLRCILFITGKGIFKKNGYDEEKTKLYYGKIRNSFEDWTRKKEVQRFILSVEQASIEYGADGAFFVYLRKNKT